jgi:hypothetical protein
MFLMKMLSSLTAVLARRRPNDRRCLTLVAKEEPSPRKLHGEPVLLEGY